MGVVHSSQLPEPFTQREVEILRLIQEGLTNQEIARALHLSLDTIKWHNQHIFSKLGVNTRTRAIQKACLYGLIDLQITSSRLHSGRQKHNLPSLLNNFIGRKTEMMELTSLLQDGQLRLVTLAGPGGVGKTRLAIHVGWELRETFPDGVFFVNLASTRETRLVIPGIAAVFNLHEIPHNSLFELLKDYLRHKRLLLILDNFEQVLPAGPQVSALMEAAPGIKVLVTSREILRLSGEQMYSLEPLALLQTGEAYSLQTLQENDAVQLFLLRGQAVNPGFHLDEMNASDVVEICQRLDGLPLAIELAAARLRLLNPPAILAQLDNCLRLLVGGARDLPSRQQTLRASLEWSYGLLSSDEQILFRRLAVFSGGCSFDAAQAICADHGMDFYAGMESLIDKHLLVNKPVGGGFRLNMFETVREFAMQCLIQSGESTAIHRKWADFYGEWMFQNFHQLHILEAELENFRAVIRWSIDANIAEPGLLIASHTWFWAKRNTEWVYWLESLLGLPDAQTLSQARQLAVWNVCLQALFDENYDRFLLFLDEFSRSADEMNSDVGRNNVNYLVGFYCIGKEDYEGAVDAFIEGLTYFRSIEDQFGSVVFTDALGVSLMLLHHYDRAQATLLEALDLSIQYQLALLTVEILTELGYLAVEMNLLSQAKEYFSRSFFKAQEIGFDAGLTDCLNGMAVAAVRQRADISAAKLFGAAHELSMQYGCPTHAPPLLLIKNRYQVALHQRLELEILESAWQEGREMTIEEAFKYGMGVTC